MAAFLCRLGRLALRRRLIAVLLWVGVLAGVGAATVDVEGESLTRPAVAAPAEREAARV
jgi:hypothetical protein